MAVKVLVSDGIAPEGMEALRAAEGVEVTDGTGWSREELLARIGEYHGLIVRSATKVDAELIEAARSLQVIGRAGVGVDNVDLAAATRRGIVVINSPEGNTVSTAEHTLAMMLALARRIPQAYVSLVREGKWERSRFVGTQLFGKTLGVIGLGRIGSEVAQRAVALGMKVLAYDPLVNEERAKRVGVTLATIEEICKAADFITVHTPLIRETEGLIGRREFDLMKPGVYVINCARGGIIDEAALYDAIKSGKVAGAALDVFAQEPPMENPLLTLEQVIATPHLGASTHEAQVSVAVDVVRSVVRALAGEPVKYAVNAPALRAAGVDGLAPYLKLGGAAGPLLHCGVRRQLRPPGSGVPGRGGALRRRGAHQRPAQGDAGAHAPRDGQLRECPVPRRGAADAHRRHQGGARGPPSPTPSRCWGAWESGCGRWRASSPAASAR